MLKNVNKNVDSKKDCILIVNSPASTNIIHKKAVIAIVQHELIDSLID